MKRYIVLMIALVSVIYGCSHIPIIGKGADKKKGSEADTARIRRAATEQEIRTMLDNDNFYWGIGTADILTSYTDARSQAKDNAITDLSRRISTQVTSEIKRTISNVATYDERQYSETERQIIEERSRFYTERVLHNIRGDREFIDHPREGVITYVLRISRQEYEEEVRKSLNDNKNMINAIIRTGNNDYNGGRYLSAINNWTQAKEMINNIFGGLPIFHDINNDGRDEEFNSYLNEQVLDIFSNIRLKTADEGAILYDAQGDLRKRPVILAHYVDKDGNEQPVASLPLQLNVIEGKVNVPRQADTGSYGQFELILSNLDASYSNTVIRVEIDTGKINRTDLFSLPVLSAMNIRFERMKTMALSVTFVNGNNVSSPNNLLQSLKRTIINKGFSVTEIAIKTDRPGSADVAAVNNSNADYFLNVYLNVSNVQSVGGYDNAFNANCYGSINLYRLPGIDNNIASEPLPAERGFGATGSNAGMNAFINIVPKVEREVDKIVSRL